MALKLMYITNRPEIASIAERTGVDRIFIDMEYIGKSLRQGGMDTVQSHHTTEDIRAIRAVLKTAQIMVRCNPIHEKTEQYPSSQEEIDAAIAAGADILMLPYFKTANEVREFIRLVDGRARTLPLVETPEAVACIDEILALDGLDEIFVGLNDLSLGYGMKFMFELLANGTVECLCNKFKEKGIPYGFGGLASLEGGLLPGKMVLKEHYRLGSSCVILARSFCNTAIVTAPSEVTRIFEEGLAKIRALEKECVEHRMEADYFERNRIDVTKIVKEIIGT
ncbi:MAG: aldolase [Clostridia bacterium]|nr:aldolase [Clostridia bacterium]